MIKSKHFLRCLLLFQTLITIIMSLPTINYFQDLNRLETYEDISDDSESQIDIFANLTFHFSCENKSVGLYADEDYDCRIFHVCNDLGQGFPVICPNDTLFNQKERVCDNEGNVDCEHASEWFPVNEWPISLETTEGNFVTTEEENLVPSVQPLL